MSVVLDILRTYRAPREVQARRIEGGPREDRALAILLAACGVIFVAQWPRFAREAFLDSSVSLEARMAGGLFGWMIVMPLVFYALSLVLTLVMRATGTSGAGPCLPDGAVLGAFGLDTALAVCRASAAGSRRGRGSGWSVLQPWSPWLSLPEQAL